MGSSCHFLHRCYPMQEQGARLESRVGGATAASCFFTPSTPLLLTLHRLCASLPLFWLHAVDNSLAVLCYVGPTVLPLYFSRHSLILPIQCWLGHLATRALVCVAPNQRQPSTDAHLPSRSPLILIIFSSRRWLLLLLLMLEHKFMMWQIARPNAAPI